MLALYDYGVAVAPKSKDFTVGTVAAPMVSVAKLVDAADCGSAGRNLVRVQVPSFTLKYAGVAQLVSASACQVEYTGSNPVTCSQMLVSACRCLCLKS